MRIHTYAIELWQMAENVAGGWRYALRSRARSCALTPSSRHIHTQRRAVSKQHGARHTHRHTFPAATILGYIEEICEQLRANDAAFTVVEILYTADSFAHPAPTGPLLYQRPMTRDRGRRHEEK